ncbi:hypothetical protein SLS62_004008 [Diatrype stigma]|uniref:Secreted protein n=1 Tax=Diatrype stigma TaxID=117547 RepID=A0AAN9UTY6_9PEZI
MHSIILLRRAAPLAAALITTLGAAAASAQNASTAIVGCDEVGCPVNADTATSECKLIDETFNEIGLARIPIGDGDDDGDDGDTDGQDAELAGISWVQGNSVTDVGGSDDRYPTERVLRRDWYFGTPAGFDLGAQNTRACAAFFHKSMAAFPEGNTETAAGTCEQAMAPECVNALVQRAQSLQFDADDSSDDLCGALEQDILSNFDVECRDDAGSPYWRNVTVRPILGGSAPAVILSSDNITSNCWPITPKEDDLAFIERLTTTTDDFGSDVLQNFFYGVTPILTAFYSGEGSPITTNTAQMTCLKTMGPSPGSNQTVDEDDDDDDDDDDDSAGTLVRASTTAALFIAASAILASIS